MLRKITRATVPMIAFGLQVIAMAVLLPILPLLFIGILTYRLILAFCLWAIWCPRGINVLLVYSNSPNWQAYVERQLLPAMPASCVVLNWSHRKQWSKLHLAVRAFREFGGAKNFNPMILTVRPFIMPKVFRFYRPFLDHKHGDSQPLHDLEAKVFSEINS